MRIDGRTSLGDIIGDIAMQYRIDAEDVQQKVSVVVENLKNKMILIGE